MNHKLAVKIAIVMIIVFGVITILYPRIYAPDPPVNPALDPVGEPAPPAGP